MQQPMCKKAKVIFYICPELASQVCQSSSHSPFKPQFQSPLRPDPWLCMVFPHVPLPVGPSPIRMRPFSVHLQLKDHAGLYLLLMQYFSPWTLNITFVETVSPYLCLGCIWLKGTACWGRKNMHFIVRLLWIKS